MKDRMIRKEKLDELIDELMAELQRRETESKTEEWRVFWERIKATVGLQKAKIQAVDREGGR